MDVTASTITIVSSAWTLAIRVNQLIAHIRHHEEGVKELAHKAETLAAIIGEVRNTYGPEKDGEEQIHQIVENVISRLQHDLASFESELSKLLDEKKTGPLRPGWVLKTWREKVAAPTFARLEKSIGSHQDSLQFLVSLLHGRRLDAGLAEVRASNERMLAMFHTLAPSALFYRRNSDVTLVPSSENTELEDQIASAAQDPALLQQLLVQYFAAWFDQISAEKGSSISLEDTSPFGPNATMLLAGGVKAFRQTVRRPSTPGPSPTEFASPLVPTTPCSRDAVNNFTASSADGTPFSEPPSLRSRAGTAESVVSQTSSLTAIESSESLSAQRGNASERTKSGSKPQAGTGVKGMQLLKAIKAEREDCTDTLERLVNNKASLEEEDEKKRTPLLVAAVSNKPNMIAMLLSRGADLRATDSKGKTALHLACEKASVGVISSLLGVEDQGDKAEDFEKIDVNATDNIGRTALHYCARRDMRDAARLIADCGANVNVKDNGGYTPAYFAITCRNYATVELLLNRRAWIDSKCLELETSSEIKKLLQRSLLNGSARQYSKSEGARLGSTGTSSGKNKPFRIAAKKK